MAFSKRLGLVPEKEIQINSMDSALKNKLYNYFRKQLMSFKNSISISSFVLNELGEVIQNDINDRETYWKNVLLSRNPEFGFNEN